VKSALLTRYPALEYPLYRRYWFASFASVGGTQLVTLAQGWLVFKLTGSALDLGLLGAAAAVPNILMSLFGGVVADRFDKRKIILITSTLTARAVVRARRARRHRTGARVARHDDCGAHVADLSASSGPRVRRCFHT
jgi:hypothetical protein